MPGSNLEIKQLQESLAGDHAERAWVDFLSAYSDVIYGTVRLIVRDSDNASDCFLFVCEKLAEREFRRLRAFHSEGRASFNTWLRAVIRNLSLDWHRSKFGRRRSFRRVADASVVDQEIYRAIFERRLALTDAWHELWSAGTKLSFDEFEKRAEVVHQMLTSRQLWLLSTSNTTFPTTTAEAEAVVEVVDTAPDPEAMTVLRDIQEKVRHALRDLSDSDRLLLRLRFEEELGLREIAAILGLKDAQTVDRRIRDALARLREKFGVTDPVRGKIRPASV